MRNIVISQDPQILPMHNNNMLLKNIKFILFRLVKQDNLWNSEQLFKARLLHAYYSIYITSFFQAINQHVKELQPILVHLIPLLSLISNCWWPIPEYAFQDNGALL